jgi:hypothetical protein
MEDSDSDSDEEQLLPPDCEIVGMECTTLGRSCILHGCCGDHVQVGDVVKLVPNHMWVDRKDINKIDVPTYEYVVKAMKIVNGQTSCFVGFVPRFARKLPKVEQHLNKFCQVVELYKNSSNLYKLETNRHNKGMASVAFLEHDSTSIEEQFN